MPPTISRIVFAAVLYLLLSASTSVAQSGSGQNGSGQPSSSHTISFSFGDYDVISNIYVFLTSGNQGTVCLVEISSIRRSGLGFLLPPAVSLSLLYQAAIVEHGRLGHIPCNESDEITFDASITGESGISGILFTLLSLLHLNDHWIYGVECAENDDPIISFIEYLNESILE